MHKLASMLRICRSNFGICCFKAVALVTKRNGSHFYVIILALLGKILVAVWAGIVQLIEEYTSPCQILWQSVEPLLRYGDLIFSKMAAIHHLGFSIVRNVTSSECNCQCFIMSNFMPVCQTIAAIWHFLT